MAQECRSRCGETCFPIREGQVLMAVLTCLRSKYVKPTRVIGLPLALRNSSGAGASPRTASQARTSEAVCFQSGKDRSFRPLPITRRVGVGCRVTAGSKERSIPRLEGQQQNTHEAWPDEVI